MWRMFRDARILGTIGVLFFLAVIADLNATVYSPEATVLRYLNALEDGRQSDVESFVWGPGAEVPHGIRVPNDPADRPHNARIVDVYEMGSMVVVTVRVDLGGKSADVDLVVNKTDSWSPLSQWVLSEPVEQLDVSSTGSSGAAVNGVAVVEAGLAYVPSIATVGSPSIWFDATDQKIVIDGTSRHTSVDLKLNPSDALVSAIDTKVHDYLDSCAKQKTLVPKKCPFAGFAAQKIAKGPIWTMVTYPEVALSEVGGVWQVSGDGSVRLEVSLVDFATEKTDRYSEVLSFELSGTIAGLAEGKPRLVVENTVER